MAVPLNGSTLNLTTISPSIPTTTIDPVREDGGLILLVIACASSSLWLIYMTFYHARVLGYIITRLVSIKYMKDGQFFEIGSLSLSILSGKIMFRDVKYITKDLSIRIVDGYAIFKYWLPYNPEDDRKPYMRVSSENEIENEQKDHRLTVWLNCFEYHVYNRSDLYDQLQDLYKVERYGDAQKSTQNIHSILDTSKKDRDKSPKTDKSKSGLPQWLLELVPAIKFDISTGKIAFGNRLFETTLCFQFESAVGFYTTSQSHSSLDQFMHVVKCNGRNLRIMLCPSPGYTGTKDEPPRFMGNGFVVLQTAECKINYYQDEPGLVPDSNHGDVEAGIPDSDPHWGVDVIFLKSTTMCYGPWVDRQRDALQKFFFPLDYQEMTVTKPLPASQTRIHTGLDVKFHFEADANLDILFSKNQETKAVHVCFGAGSHLGVYQPWTVNEYGYTTSVVTKLYHVEASTSMAYRKLANADTLDLAVHMSFPRVWNQTQHWSCDINVTKVTWWFIFAHKWFFQEMLDDWTASYRPDLLTFVPYEWSFNIILRDFEMVWAANEHNYLECTSNKQEMAELAFCGELFDLTFVLQFLRFLPEVEEIKFFLQVEKLVARLCLPEHDTMRRSFLSLSRMTTKQQTQQHIIRSRSSTNTALPEEGIESADEITGLHGTSNEMTTDIFRRHTAQNIGWVDVMSVPILGLSIGYTYHPIIPNPKYNVPRDEPLKWQPSDLEPDVITLELEAGPAALRLFGSVLKILAAIKENYFGIDQVFQECAAFNSNQTDFQETESTPDTAKNTINLFALRPLEANVFISLYDFKTELTKHCGVNEPCSPLLLFERLTFEMHKSYAETRLQLHLTPMTILVSDKYERGVSGHHLSQGHLSLSGFQLRGHAMFSEKGLPPDSETLEYAWLTELQFGILSGKITLPQLQALLNWGQTFAFHLLNKENRLRPASPYNRCIHGLRQDRCSALANSTTNLCSAHQQSSQLESKTDRKTKATTNPDDKGRKPSSLHPRLTLGVKNKGSVTPEVKEEDKEGSKVICVTEDDLKYRMTRISVEDINLFIVETGVACNIQVSPVRLAMCNLHCENHTTGLSLFIQTAKLRQFILAPQPIIEDPVLDDVHKCMSLCDDIIWMEAASLLLGPVISDISLAEGRKDQLDQKSFLKMHDEKYQRIWFLWSSSEKSPHKRQSLCGCVGGCNFFGKNVNGPRFFSSEKLDASANDTGITGFGCEGGFYDDWELNNEEDAKPFMYSHDALGSSYLDQSPVGSVEAFTRKRYHGSEASSSPKLRRPAYLKRAAQKQEDTNDRENDPGNNRLSWQSSLRRTSSSVSAKPKYMHTSSLRESKTHLPPQTRPLHSCSSQISRESEGSFYSCGSLLDDLDNVSPLQRGISIESFASAVENPDDLMKFSNGETQVSNFVVSCPQLVNRYSQQLSQLECLNWNVPAAIPTSKRMFSIVQNLKETEPSDPLLLPGVPQFNYRNPPKFKYPLLVKKYQGPKERKGEEEDADVSSSSSGTVFDENVKLNLSQVEKPSPEHDDVRLGENSEQDSIRKARWNSAMNENNQDSVTSADSSSDVRSSKKKQSSLQNLVIFRFDGDVNVFLTPLCVDALQRYISSISRQDAILHPALVVDLVHDMCSSTAEEIYQKRLDENLTPGLHDPNVVSKTNEVVALISTSNINLCFLQVAVPELKAETRNEMESFQMQGESFKAKEPSTSLLAGSLDGVSAKVFSVQKAAVNKSNNADSQDNVHQADKQSAEGKPVFTSKALHRNTSTVFNGKCNQVQLQLHELSNKDDFDNSVTTAITDQSSKSKFLVNGDHLRRFTESSCTDDMPQGSYFSLLMLECGLEKISVHGGSECGNGHEILPKIGCRSQERHRTDKDKMKDSNGAVFHGFANPMPEHDTGSIRIDMNTSDDEKKSEKSGLSSLTSSLSFLTSSSGGNDSDIESEGELDVYEPLLQGSKSQDAKNEDQEKDGKDDLQDKDVELARRIDIDIHLSSIWLNIASPPSSRTVPENYHLYNSLVTTIVPLSVAWIPGVIKLTNLIKEAKINRDLRFSSVIACLMSQALPEHGKIPKKHGIHYLVTNVSKFLQEDHSSQLIYHLRRQLIGSRLSKVKTALLQKESIPETKKLVKGIFALARQWKCFLAGTEKGEILFYGTNSIKRHVVGRGVLTERDRAILMKEESNAKENMEPAQEPCIKVTEGALEAGNGVQMNKNNADQQQQDQGESSSSPVNHSSKSPASLTLPLETLPFHTSHTPSSQRTPLLQTSSAGAQQHTDSDTDDSPPTTMRKGQQTKTIGENKAQKYGHRKQISLYSWLSNTPVTSPNAVRQADVDNLNRPSQSPQASPDKSDQDDKLFTEMVSVPTSGKKIQDEKETFKTLLQAINLKPKVAAPVDTANAISLKTSLKYIRLDLVDNEVNNISKKRSQEGQKEGKRPSSKSSSESKRAAKELFTEKDPIFLAKDFVFRLIFSNSPAGKDFPTDVPSLANSMVKHIKFNVGCGNVTQKVNLHFVRLAIQLLDTVDVLSWFIKSKYQELIGDSVDGPTPEFTTIFRPKERPRVSPSSVKCWKIMYQVLDLYSSLPREPKSKGNVKKASSTRPVRVDIPSPDQVREVKIDIEDGPSLPSTIDKRRSVASRSTWDSKGRDQETNFVVVPTYIVLGVVTFPRVRLLAAIGDLLLETEIRDVSLAITRQEEKDNNESDHCSGSVSGHVGNVNTVLLERVKRKTGMVVSCHLSRSNVIYTTASEFQREKNLALITIGVIDVEIPQHPVALHTMMTRSSRTISRHISDIQTQRSVIRSMGSHEMSPNRLSKRISGVPAEFVKHHLGSPTGFKMFSPIDSVDGSEIIVPRVKFDVILKGFSLGASLLPSLRAGYKIGRICATAHTGPSIMFKGSMPSHSLLFSSKVQSYESNVPSSTMVDLPPVKVSGEFLTNRHRQPKYGMDSMSHHQRGKRGHLYVSTEIGSFQHSLTTDLLNHLVFVQKSFMKEVNDVVQRVSGESQPVPLWRTVSSESLDSSKHKEAPFLYSFGLTLKGIQVTATTPAATAVRLDTGEISLELSNAIPSHMEPGRLKRSGSFIKLFGKAQVDVNLSLGQFMKSRMIDNELDYLQMAYFKTTIGVRNSFQDVSSMHGTEDKETFLITLEQPKVYAQQIAFDKAVLVYLNYKNAYDHWNQQRMALNDEVHTATQAVLEKLPARTHAAQLSGSLFLQLTVNRLGICVPILTQNQSAAQGTHLKQTDPEQGSALVLSVEEMMLSCCSSTSFVSKGKFNKFCLWFADKFDKEDSDWRPDLSSRLMNKCVVPHGTYELCSRTNRYPILSASEMVKTGKWMMSIRWQMCGVEILLDTNIGKQLSMLGSTLTAFGGETDVANMDSVAEVTEKDVFKESGSVDEVDNKDVPSQKQSKRNIEREMWEQARKVNELRRRNDVSHVVLERETKVLQDLENAVFNEFRKDVRKKLRRHSRGRQSSQHHLTSKSSPPRHRKVKSERVRGSRSRTRIRRQIAEDFDESDYDVSEMVDMSATVLPRSRDEDYRLNNTDIPVVPPFNLEDEEQANLDEDLIELEDRSQGNISRLASTPDSKDAAVGLGSPKVTFSTSTNDIQDQSAANQRGNLLPQQNLDFELDVIVNIDSGKCVLHSANEGDNEELNDQRPLAARLFAADPPRTRSHFTSYPSSSGGVRRYKASNQESNSLPKDTVILLPGVDVRVNYSSSFDSESGMELSPTSHDNGLSPSSSFPTPRDPPAPDSHAQGVPVSRKVSKKAGVYISVLFQSLPQEMVLKPSLIDFLEQALEPIIIPFGDEGIDGVGSVSDNSSDPEFETGGSIVSSSMSEASSFPVDVVVVFRVQPSDIRLSCQPVSKVECMLRLPALDMVFSSKSSPSKSPILPSPHQTGEERRQETRDSQILEAGGVSFTFCLSSFSFCIFHPYGKEHTVIGRTTSTPLEGEIEVNEENRPRFRFTPPQPISGKKDSLSLDVEFVKFHLSRRRVGSSNVGDSRDGTNFPTSSTTVVKVSGVCDIGSAAFTYDMRRLNEILDFPKAWYKRKLVSRLFLGKEGSYAAKTVNVATNVPYHPSQSMDDSEGKRRSSPTMTENQRPRPTQGRPLLSRSLSEDERRLPNTLSPLKIPTKQKSVTKKGASPSSGLFGFLPTSPILFRSMTMAGSKYGLLSNSGTPSPYLQKRHTFTDRKIPKKNEESPLLVAEQSSTDTDVDGPLSKSSSSSSGSKSKWETVIVVALNLSRLDVNTNMGSVMGQTMCSTSDLRAQSHLTLTSTGRRHFKAKMKVRQAVCESRSGIVGGHIEINEFISKANVTEERGCKPEHLINLKVCHSEARIDYMGTCILMGNLSALKTVLRDEWVLQEAYSASTDTLLASDKEAPIKSKIYVRADMSWTDFKLMISRSTTPDFIKMIAKIQEFFTQQHRNSLRALSTLRNPTPLTTGTILSNLAMQQLSVPHNKEKDSDNDGLKYQHWSKVLNALSGLKLCMLSSPIPERGVVLGGSLALHGKTVSLACFHGVNFRAQSWVLFNLKQIYTEFVSKARSEEKSCQVRRARVVQTLLIKLGQGDEEAGLPGNFSPSSAHMAIVRKVSRGRRNPPSMGSTVQEWLTYVCATGDDDIYPSDEEPVTTKQRGDSFSNSNKKVSQASRNRTSGYRYEHDSEPIFALPRFEVELITEHDMPMTYMASTWARRKHSTGSRVLPGPSSPHVVECSLTSSFEDSLCVTMDVGLLFFLHDVVQSYIKENETSSSASIPRGSPSPARSETDTKVSEKDDRDKSIKVDQQKRIRQFRSKAWKLEPRVRFMSWAGKNIDPVNIDWVLQKLGFTHARLTIPKWAQRGAMDPMDVVICLLIDQLMAAMREESNDD